MNTFSFFPVECADIVLSPYGVPRALVINKTKQARQSTLCENMTLKPLSSMDNHPSDETVIAATPEVSPLVGSLSTANFALLSFALALFLFVGPFH